jgi:Legionella pneumophila major outer membrane protein precursor
MSNVKYRGIELRAILCTGLSVAALMAAAPASAADLAVKAVPPPRGETRLWVEGGAFWTGSDRIPFAAGFGAAFGGGGLGLGSSRISPNVGWDVAAGFDHRIAGTSWHVNGQARYGTARRTDNVASSFLIAAGGLAINGAAATAATLNEWHWNADLGIGYEVFPVLQVNFGLRIAEVAARVETDTTANITAAIGAVALTVNAANNRTHLRSFLGAGPRAGIEGSIPLFGGLTFDYSGDGAVLFGNTKIDTNASSSFSIAAPPVFVLAVNGINSSATWSKQITVLNADIQGGIGYWITPYMKFALSYRLDAYFDALRSTPDDTLPGQSIDRFYHGPKATLTGRF